MSNEVNNQEIPLRAISELKGYTFQIPFQQRGYKWTSQNVRDLLSDLYDFIHAPERKRVYCLQPLAVTKVAGGTPTTFSVQDGQQRLTTLFLLQKYLFGEAPYSFAFERDETLPEKDQRWTFLQHIPSLECDKKADMNIDFYFINNAYKTIENCFSTEAKDKNQIFGIKDSDHAEQIRNDFRELLLRGKNDLRDPNDPKSRMKSVQVIWYVVPEDQKHKIFINLNSGKIGLTNTELIKALFLNRESGLPKGMREEAAAQFEMIERYLQNDKFWYMLQPQEGNGVQMRESKKVRTDLLFNLVASIKKEDYDKDPRISFSWFANHNTGELIRKWEQVRHTFYRLLDMYNDIVTYHYIGYLTYYHKEANSYGFLNELLSYSRKTKKSEFIALLRQKIRMSLLGNQRKLSDFYYDKKMIKDLRRLFLLHNIETIILKYKDLKENDDLKLQSEYERFPFDLLHKQNWDIEHIASQTDNKMDNAQDREDWYISVKTDYPKYFEAELVKDESDLKILESDKDRQWLATIRLFESRYVRSKKQEDFMKMYNAVIRYNDSQEQGAIAYDDKNRVGNLTLLDSHTNRGYHNALFPRKRKYVIISNGLKAETDDLTLKTLYIPACTRQVFTKSYSKSSATVLSAWLQKDAEAYEADMLAKLCDSADGKIKRFLLANE